MSIVRSYLFLALAVGVTFSGLSDGSAVAQDGRAQKATHDHDAMVVEKKISSAFATLSPDDRKRAEAQRFCPMMVHSRLGAMGTPIKVPVNGKPVFVCCKECVDDAMKGGAATLETAQKLTDASAMLAKLPAKERAVAEAQKYCAIANKNFLGSMGVPAKVRIDGKPVYLCCKGCLGKAQANPAVTLAKVEELKKAGMHDGHDHHNQQHDNGHGRP